MTKRPHVPLAVKLACALSELENLRRTGLPFDHLQRMDAKDYLARFEWDHVIPHAHAGSIHFSNLTPMLKADHRIKTAKIDIPRIAKAKRIRRDEATHHEALARKYGQIDVTGDLADTPKSRHKHIIPGSKSSPYRKKLNGKVVPR